MGPQLFFRLQVSDFIMASSVEWWDMFPTKFCMGSGTGARLIKEMQITDHTNVDELSLWYILLWNQ